MLALAALLAVVRFGPDRAKLQAANLYLFAAGDVKGCGIDDIWRPLDADLRDAGLKMHSQIRQLEVDGPLVRLQTPAGSFWTPLGNDSLFLLAEYAVDIYGVGGTQIRPGDVVMDLGANVGMFSRRALDAGASRVIAVEPSPLNVESLRRTFAEEIEDGRFILVPKAVWNEPGRMMLKVYDLSVLDSLVMEERPEAPVRSEVPVELVTIDALAEELGLERLDFVKMDIEGAERQAIEGAVETLRRFRPRMAIATENLLDDIEAVPAAVLAAVPGYTARNGRCRNIRDGVLRPEVVEFLPPAPDSQAGQS